jgi:hypothetical protein
MPGFTREIPQPLFTKAGQGEILGADSYRCWAVGLCQLF